MPNVLRLRKIMTSAKTIRWSFRLSQWEPCSSNAQDVAAWSKVLSSIQREEIERINGYYFKESAKSAAIGRSMIRRAIVEMTGSKWSDVKLGRTSKGKPILVDENGEALLDSHFSFNMSHHGDHVLVVCENGASSMCGVDVMKIEIPTFKKTIDEYLDFMKSKFSQREFSSFGRYSNDRDKLILFYRYWCLKESYLKATGTGIHSKLSSLDFEVETFDLPFDKTCQDTVLWMYGVKQPFTFEEYWIDENHVAAVCLNEVENYFNERRASHDTDPLEWWESNKKLYLHLAKLARRYLGAPATSVPSEQLFSGAGIIFQPLRNRISGESVEKLSFLKYNFSEIVSQWSAKIVVE